MRALIILTAACFVTCTPKHALYVFSDIDDRYTFPERPIIHVSLHPFASLEERNLYHRLKDAFAESPFRQTNVETEADYVIFFAMDDSYAARTFYLPYVEQAETKGTFDATTTSTGSSTRYNTSGVWSAVETVFGIRSYTSYQHRSYILLRLHPRGEVDTGLFVPVWEIAASTAKNSYDQNIKHISEWLSIFYGRKIDAMHFALPIATGDKRQALEKAMNKPYESFNKPLVIPTSDPPATK